MHKTSMENMRRFVEGHLGSRKGEELVILDLGSQDVNGSYKQLLKNPKWKYIGADIESGKNVDVVLNDIYNWKEIASNSVDVVVSGQAFEHIEYIWLTMGEIKRIMKPGGLGCLIAPSSGYEHRYPVDCWRILPDGFKALVKYTEMEVVDSYISGDDLAELVGEENTWKDTVLIFRKPNE